jgi:salicylate hydroxylase
LLTQFQDSADEVIIHFEDATTATANLVVGADGIHSVIRSQFAPDDLPNYAGQIAYRGLLPLSVMSTDWPFPSYAVSWVGKNKHFLCFPISRNKTLNVVAFVAKSEEQLGDLKESWTSMADKSELEAEFEGWDPKMRQVMTAMEQRVGKWRINDRDLLEQWVYVDGKVVLLGDAAHAMLPHQGVSIPPFTNKQS